MFDEYLGLATQYETYNLNLIILFQDIVMDEIH